MSNFPTTCSIVFTGHRPYCPMPCIRTVADITRQQAQTVKAGIRTDLRPHKDVMRLSTKQGNNSVYTLRRTARNSPETLAAFKRGEFSSVAAAARAAGISVQERSALEVLQAARPNPLRSANALRHSATINVQGHNVGSDAHQASACRKNLHGQSRSSE